MPDATPTCPVCQKPATKRCSKCRAVSYCSFACQKHAWPEHKVVCGWTMEEPEEEEKKDDAFASFVKMRQEQRKKQEEAKEKHQPFPRSPHPACAVRVWPVER